MSTRSKSGGNARTHEVVVQPEGRPQRQVAVFLGVMYLLALTVAIALRGRDLAALLTIFVPVIAVAVTVPLTTPRGQRREVWRQVGFRRPRTGDLGWAVLGPLAVTVASFGFAVAIGVIELSGSGWGDRALDVVIVTAIFSIVILGEEIGWRGFLLLRLRDMTSGRSAAVITGGCHALFHVPLLTITTTYQSEGSRWVVVPMVMVTITLAGVWYGWLRFRSGSIWPVSLSHSAFNSLMDAGTSLAVASSAVTMSYVTTETGVATLLATAILAVYLLLCRKADFEQSRPSS